MTALSADYTGRRKDEPGPGSSTHLPRCQRSPLALKDCLPPTHMKVTTMPASSIQRTSNRSFHSYNGDLPNGHAQSYSLFPRMALPSDSGDWKPCRQSTTMTEYFNFEKNPAATSSTQSGFSGIPC